MSGRPMPPRRATAKWMCCPTPMMRRPNWPSRGCGRKLRLIGAHGVVGVRLAVVRHEWADKTVEVQVIGTAVAGPGAAPSDPWMSDLSGQEWWALHRAGYEPAALVWGHCTWFILTTQQDEWIRAVLDQSGTDPLERRSGPGAAHCHGAPDRRRRRKHHATGIAGVQIARRMDEVRLSGPGEDPAYEREHHNLVVSIIGTAIRLRPDAPARRDADRSNPVPARRPDRRRRARRRRRQDRIACAPRNPPRLPKREEQESFQEQEYSYSSLLGRRGGFRGEASERLLITRNHHGSKHHARYTDCHPAAARDRAARRDARQRRAEPPVHQRPFDQRAFAGQRSGLRSGRPGRRQLDLPCRLSAVGVVAEPGDDCL